MTNKEELRRVNMKMMDEELEQVADTSLMLATYPLAVMVPRYNTASLVSMEMMLVNNIVSVASKCVNSLFVVGRAPGVPYVDGKDCRTSTKTTMIDRD